MKNLIKLLLCVFALSASAGSQKCKLYFTVIQSDVHLPGGSLAAMSVAQEKWWAKKGAKEYSDICYDPSRATYKVVWWKETVSDNFVARNVADPRYDTTIHRTRDIGSAYVKRVGAPESDKPLFFVDGDHKGTADALEKAVKFLTHVENAR